MDYTLQGGKTNYLFLKEVCQCKHNVIYHARNNAVVTLWKAMDDCINAINDA